MHADLSKDYLFITGPGGRSKSGTQLELEAVWSPQVSSSMLAAFPVKLQSQLPDVSCASQVCPAKRMFLKLDISQQDSSLLSRQSRASCGNADVIV